MQLTATGMAAIRSTTRPAVGEGIQPAAAKSRRTATEASGAANSRPSSTPASGRSSGALAPGSSPLICNGYVYITSGGGQAKAMCLKLDSGEIFWAQKLPGQEISSPILADGKILTFMGGAREMWMIQATPEKYTFLVKGQVDAANCSSPAIVGTRLYLRTNQGVACFDLAAVPPPPPPAPAAADAKPGAPAAK